MLLVMFLSDYRSNRAKLTRTNSEKFSKYHAINYWFYAWFNVKSCMMYDYRIWCTGGFATSITKKPYSKNRDYVGKYFITHSKHQCTNKLHVIDHEHATQMLIYFKSLLFVFIGEKGIYNHTHLIAFFISLIANHTKKNTSHTMLLPKSHHTDAKKSQKHQLAHIRIIFSHYQHQCHYLEK